MSLVITNPGLSLVNSTHDLEIVEYNKNLFQLLIEPLEWNNNNYVSSLRFGYFLRFSVFYITPLFEYKHYVNSNDLILLT